jgi:hypothetical protein
MSAHKRLRERRKAEQAELMRVTRNGYAGSTDTTGTYSGCQVESATSRSTSPSGTVRPSRFSLA